MAKCNLLKRPWKNTVAVKKIWPQKPIGRESHVAVKRRLAMKTIWTWKLCGRENRHLAVKTPFGRENAIWPWKRLFAWHIRQECQWNETSREKNGQTAGYSRHHKGLSRERVCKRLHSQPLGSNQAVRLHYYALPFLDSKLPPPSLQRLLSTYTNIFSISIYLCIYVYVLKYYKIL